MNKDPQAMERTMIRYPIAAAIGFAALLAAPGIEAHHGWSGYDAQTVLTLTGTLEDINYANPHVEVAVKIENKTWKAVLAPMFRMDARGLPQGSLKVGDTVTLIGYPHRDKVGELRAERIVAVGKTVELR
jgi:Family of unknown function (DUF6152)